MSFYTVPTSKNCKVWNSILDIKFWMICDADTYYVLQAFPYTGKQIKLKKVLPIMLW